MGSDKTYQDEYRKNKPIRMGSHKTHRDWFNCHWM